MAVFGYTDIYGTEDYLGDDWCIGLKVTVPADCSAIDSLDLYMRKASGTSAVKCAVFSHDAANNRPAKSLGVKESSFTSDVIALSWQKFLFASPVAVTPGASVWFLVSCGNYLVYYRRGTTAGQLVYDATVAYSTWPSGAFILSGTEAGPMSFRANYTPLWVPGSLDGGLYDTLQGGL